MANNVKVRITQNNIEKMKKDLGDNLLNALNEIGAVATGHAQENTPFRTGALKSSYSWEVNKRNKKMSYGVRIDAPSFEKGKSKPIDYYEYVEDGSSKQKAQHMFRRSLTEHINEYAQIIRDALNK